MKATPHDELHTPAKENSSLRDRAAAGQAPPEIRQLPRGYVHLVIGPVGAGKSTFALALAREHRAVRLTLDQWMTTLFRPDRPEQGVMPWYVERSARCLEQIWTVTLGILEAGTDAILEIGLLTRRERDAFYAKLDAAFVDFTLHVVDAAREVRRQRVTERNQTQGSTFSMVVPPEIFELASDLWQSPEPLECEGRRVHFIRT
jgi:predicted kinase